MYWKIAVLVASLTMTGAGSVSASPMKTFTGAWFSVSFPATFSPHRGMPSGTSDRGCDSATFTSPGGTAQFYVYSPQWHGEAIDAKVNLETEEIVSESAASRATALGKISVTWTTIRAKNGLYWRSLVDRHDDMGGESVFGFRYANEREYRRYLPLYVAFKTSLSQYADGR